MEASMFEPKIYKENDVFRSGPNIQMNACVGDNGGPYDFSAYASGFFEAARLLIRATEAQETTIDIIVYPVCFNFRHGVELYLKYAARAVQEIRTGEAVYKKDHSLVGTWRALKANFLAMELQIHPDEVEYIDHIVKCFEEVDPTGQTFRYPENSKHERHLTDRMLINLDVIGSKMESVEKIFSLWTSEIGNALDYVQERRSE